MMQKRSLVLVVLLAAGTAGLFAQSKPAARPGLLPLRRPTPRRARGPPPPGPASGSAPSARRSRRAASPTSRSIPRDRRAGTWRRRPAACGRPRTAARRGRPIFDGEGSYSIGCVTLDPATRSPCGSAPARTTASAASAYGDGVYARDDGGKSWKNIGLKNVRAHRQDRRRTRGTPTSSTSRRRARCGRPGGDRGLYKTTDGGKTWKARPDGQREHRRRPTS